MTVNLWTLISRGKGADIIFLPLFPHPSFYFDFPCPLPLTLPLPSHPHLSSSHPFSHSPLLSSPSPSLPPSPLPFPPLRSFYKHVLGNPVDYTDLEAIEPEIFKSLKQILNLSLEDLGLELTFSAESHIFGKHEVRVDALLDAE